MTNNVNNPQLINTNIITNNAAVDNPFSTHISHEPSCSSTSYPSLHPYIKTEQSILGITN